MPAGGRIFRFGAPLVIVALALAGFVFLRATAPETAPTPVPERVWTVAGVDAVPRDVQPEIKAFGQIVAGRQVELRPLVEGRVVRTGPHFAEGGIVAEGELLIAIDPFDYERVLAERRAQVSEATARLEEIEAELSGARKLVADDRKQVELATRDVARRKRLLARGATSEKAYDDAELTLSQARQRLVQRERDIRQFETRLTQQRAAITRLEAQLRQAERDLEQTELRAPFTGFLANVASELGKRVSRSDPVALLIDAARLEVRFHLSDDNFGRVLAAGDWRERPVRAVWTSGEVSRSFDARIDRIQAEVDAARGGVELFARLEGQGPATPLRPGAFVEVWVEGQHHENVVVIPEIALHEGPKVFVAVDGRLKARKVTVVARDADSVLVRGYFENGTKVVTTRFPEIAEGLKVEVH